MHLLNVWYIVIFMMRTINYLISSGEELEIIKKYPHPSQNRCTVRLLKTGKVIDDVDYMQIGVGQIPDGLSAHNLTFCDNFPDYLGLGIGKNR